MGRRVQIGTGQKETPIVRPGRSETLFGPAAIAVAVTAKQGPPPYRGRKFSSPAFPVGHQQGVCKRSQVSPVWGRYLLFLECVHQSAHARVSPCHHLAGSLKYNHTPTFPRKRLSHSLSHAYMRTRARTRVHAHSRHAGAEACMEVKTTLSHTIFWDSIRLSGLVLVRA